MYQRIREEGFNHSHVMEFGSALMDGIGPRLTGSPNLAKANAWTRDTLTKIGLDNAHLEDWGEFGLGWQQLNTWARMVTPDTAILIVQATPWSPSTPGPVTGDVVFVSIQTDKDFDQYKGKLEGKVVLFGAMREVPPVDKALFERYTDKDLEDIAEFPVTGGGGLTPEMQARMRERQERMRLIDKIAQFFADEKVAAVIEPSRDGKNGGGSGGTLFDDNGATLGRTPYIADKKVKIPVAVAAIESYGDGNIRVRSAEARIGGLEAEIARIGGSSKDAPADVSGTNADGSSSDRNSDLYPPLRQLPRLAVPYANLYREVQVQEGVYELLTQQYELARIQEAKDVPVVSVIDAPGIPEKKSFPPRLLLALLVSAISVVITSFLLLLHAQWRQMRVNDPRKELVHEIAQGLQQWLQLRLSRTKAER
jgi:hypothetical protein